MKKGDGQVLFLDYCRLCSICWEHLNVISTAADDDSCYNSDEFYGRFVDDSNIYDEKEWLEYLNEDDWYKLQNPNGQHKVNPEDWEDRLISDIDEDCDENKFGVEEGDNDDGNRFNTCDWNPAKPLTVYRDFL